MPFHRYYDHNFFSVFQSIIAHILETKHNSGYSTQFHLILGEFSYLLPSLVIMYFLVIKIFSKKVFTVSFAYPFITSKHQVTENMVS